MPGQAPIHAPSKTSLLPLYYQVERDMRRQIETGSWPPGHQIPSEKELCSLYDVSRITIRQAVSALVDEGLIVRERGRGSFVRGPVITAGARGLTSFSDEMAALGMRPGARVLSMRREPSTSDLAERLHLMVGEPIVVIHRLRYANESPIGIQTAYLPGARFPDLEHADLTEQSLYQYLDAQYGVELTEAHETFSITAITGDEARLLNVQDGACGFHVERLTFDQRKDVFEFVTSIMRGDRYQVQLVLRTNRRER